MYRLPVYSSVTQKTSTSTSTCARWFVTISFKAQCIDTFEWQRFWISKVLKSTFETRLHIVIVNRIRHLVTERLHMFWILLASWVVLACDWMNKSAFILAPFNGSRRTGQCGHTLGYQTQLAHKRIPKYIEERMSIYSNNRHSLAESILEWKCDSSYNGIKVWTRK